MMDPCRRFAHFGLMGVVLLAAACGDSEGAGGQGGDPGTEREIQGAVEKGPFVLGSSVTVSLLSSGGTPTGDVIPTQTENDAGAFELATAWTGLVAIEADGFYFNEVTGDLSGAGLTLRAHGDLSSSDQVYVNLITHLIDQRVETLIEGGASFTDAASQAEAELVAAHGIGPSGFDPQQGANQTSLLAGDSDASAYVLAVSAVFLQAALTEAGPDGPLDATFQDLLNTSSSAFSATGALPAPTRERLAQAEQDVDGDAVMQNLADRLVAIGSASTVPNIQRVLDPDQDDVANLDDNCPVVANPGQEDSDEDGIGDACGCGNGVVDIGEACDDGNAVTLDGCEPSCEASCQLLVAVDDIDDNTAFGPVFDLGDNTIFFLFDPETGERNPWVVDDATGETEALLGGPALATDAAVLNGVLFWNDSDGYVWRADGTLGGTEMTDLRAPGQLLVHDGAIYTTRYTPAEGDSVVRTDGTAAGSEELFTGGASVSYLTILDGDLLFLVNTMAGTRELWRSAGAIAPAEMVASVPLSGSSTNSPLPTALGLAFIPSEVELPAITRTDGTAAGTFTLYQAVGNKYPSVYGVELDGAYYFNVFDNNGYALFRTDGTVAGTTSIDLGYEDASPFAVFDGELLVTALNNPVLLRSDGTAAGTSVLLNDVLGLRGVFFSRLFFARGSATDVWHSEGDEASARMLVSNLVYPLMFEAGDYLYMTVDDPIVGKGAARCRMQ